MYRVELSQKVADFLDKLDHHIKERIEERLRYLEVTPIPTDAKFITREDYGKVFRYRIGNFRALYVLKENEKVILITKVDKRARVYQD